MIIAFVKLLITLEHNDTFTSNKVYLTPSIQTIHLIPSLTNLVDQQMRYVEVEIIFDENSYKRSPKVTFP